MSRPNPSIIECEKCDAPPAANLPGLRVLCDHHLAEQLAKDAATFAPPVPRTREQLQAELAKLEALLAGPPTSFYLSTYYAGAAASIRWALGQLTRRPPSALEV